VDEAGNIVDANDNGMFATGALNINMNYAVHALNFDPTNPPSPLTTTPDPSQLTGTTYAAIGTPNLGV